MAVRSRGAERLPRAQIALFVGSRVDHGDFIDPGDGHGASVSVLDAFVQYRDGGGGRFRYACERNNIGAGVLSKPGQDPVSELTGERERESADREHVAPLVEPIPHGLELAQDVPAQVSDGVPTLPYSRRRTSTTHFATDRRKTMTRTMATTLAS